MSFFLQYREQCRTTPNRILCFFPILGGHSIFPIPDERNETSLTLLNYRKNELKKYNQCQTEASRTWSREMKNLSCTELSQKLSSVFIYKWIFDFAMFRICWNPNALCEFRYGASCTLSQSRRLN